MHYNEDEHNRDKSDMLSRFNKAILDAENLRKAATPLPECPEESPESAGDVPTAAPRTGQQP